MKSTTKPVKKAAPKAKNNETFSAEEREAMKDYVREKKVARGKGAAADAEGELLASIAKMPEPDRSLATRVHALVKAAGPGLTSKTWYGMPAYANADGKVVCFFQNASKFKVRYATLGFNEAAKLDDGAMWPVAYALTKLTAAVEGEITALVKKAVG